MQIHNQKISEARQESSNHYGGHFRQFRLKNIQEESAGLLPRAKGIQHPLGSFLPFPSLPFPSPLFPSALLLTPCFISITGLQSFRFLLLQISGTWNINANHRKGEEGSQGDEGRVCWERVLMKMHVMYLGLYQGQGSGNLRHRVLHLFFLVCKFSQHAKYCKNIHF